MCWTRLTTATAIVVAALTLAACAGSTDPATNIGLDQATLHGHGTTSNVTTHVFFQFWPTAQPQYVSSTTGRDIGGGATGPVSETTASFPAPFGGALAYATKYSFRLCGQDQGAAKPVCAQTLSFQTAAPAGDVIRGGFSEQTGHGTGFVDAHSDPSGANPGGSMSLPSSVNLGGAFSGTVTCMALAGARGAVGAVGTDNGQPATALFEIDTTTSGAGSPPIGFSIAAGSTAPNCAAATYDNLFTPSVIDAFHFYNAP